MGSGDKGDRPEEPLELVVGFNSASRGTGGVHGRRVSRLSCGTGAPTGPVTRGLVRVLGDEGYEGVHGTSSPGVASIVLVFHCL